MLTLHQQFLRVVPGTRLSAADYSGKMGGLCIQYGRITFLISNNLFAFLGLTS